MDLSKLKPAEGSTRSNKRLGRGQGSGRGGTSTKGHKGQKSRSGYKRRMGFEGGQMPLQRRVPKFGFKNINRKSYKSINVGMLEKLAEDKGIQKIDEKVLFEAGLISRKSRFKILGKGNLTKKLEVRAHAFSRKAAEMIEAREGTVEKL